MKIQLRNLWANPSILSDFISGLRCEKRMAGMRRVLKILLFGLLVVCFSTSLPVVIQAAVTSDVVSSPPAPPEKKPEPSRIIVIGNKDTKRYHLPGMPGYDKVEAGHRVVFNSEQEAVDSGYYKAGTGKDAQKATLPDKKAVRKPDQPEVVVPSAQKNERVLETSKDEITGKTADKQALSAKVVVVGNRDTRRYHLPGMPYYDKVKAYHRVVFNSEQEAVDSGYYKAGTGKDAQKATLPDKKTVRKPDQPEVVVPSAQKNERVLETSKDEITGKTADKQALSAKVVVVGNRDTRRYHLPGMPYYDKVKAYHRVAFNSEQEAVDSGYYKAGTGKDAQKGKLAGGKVQAGSRQEVVIPLDRKVEAPQASPLQSAPSPVAETPKPTGEAAPAVAAPPEPSVQPVPEPAKEAQIPAAEAVKEKAEKKEAAHDVPAGVVPPATGLENFAVAQAGDIPVKIEADNLSYDNERDVYAGEGNVVITYGAGVLTASSVEYDRKNRLATARGGALLKMAEDLLAGDKIVVNVEDKTGVAYNSKVFYARNHFYIKGDKIEKTGEASYRIEQPLATTCDGDNPDWQLAGSEMKVTIDGYGWVTNARLLTKGLPVVYTPVVAFPAKTTRQTGFLFPYFAYSRNKDGLDIEIPFFWAINPQLDATFYSRYMEKRGFKEGVEFRYFLGGHSFGTLYGDYMDDNKRVTETIGDTLSRDWEGMHRRWSYMINHQTNFDSQFYIRTDLRQVSDAWYFRDFNAHNYYRTNFDAMEQDPFRKISFQGTEYLRSLESTARAFKGWNNFNVMARISSTDDFAINNNDGTLQKYPEIIVTGIKQPLYITPAYIEFAGTYDYFYRKEGARGHYLDVAPAVSLPLAISRYAKITPQLTVREIYWNRDDKEAESGNRSSDRTVVNAGVIVSSRLSRVFDIKILDWDKFQHEIKPEIGYSYIPGVRQENIPDYLPRITTLLDPFTSFKIGGENALMEQNAVAWALTNTITARSTDKTGANSYTDVLRFKLFQVYDINEAKRGITDPADSRRPVSDLGIEFDLKPHPYLAFAARNKYSMYNGWKEQNYDLKLSDWRKDELTFSYRYTLDSVEAFNMDLKAVITERLSGRLAIRLDMFNDQTVENTVGLTYKEQCWSVGADYTRTHDDERIIFRISLTGLGMPGF